MLRASSTQKAAALLLLTTLAAGPAAAQSVLYVDDDAPPGGDGLSWDTACRCFQDALQDAVALRSVSEIHLAGGTYKPDQDESGLITPGDQTAAFELLDGLAIRGGYAGWANLDNPEERDVRQYATILSGDLAGDDGDFFSNYDENSSNVVIGSHTDASAVLDGVTIIGALDSGMLCYVGNATLIDCTFTRNWGYYGGGLVIWSSNLTLINCNFLGNWAGYGGGMYNAGGDPLLVNCLFSGNGADAGG
jgi:hypothetical protein